MIITIVAPGNKFRRSNFPPPPDLFNLIRISLLAFVNFIQYLVSSFYRWIIIFALFISSLILGTTQINQALKGKNLPKNNQTSNYFLRSYPITLGSIVVLSLLIMHGCFLPSAYGMSSKPSSRTLINAIYVFSITILLIGIVTGRR